MNTWWDWVGAVVLLGWAWIAWWALGWIARMLGTGRLQVVGLAALVAWLAGR